MDFLEFKEKIVKIYNKRVKEEKFLSEKQYLNRLAQEIKSAKIYYETKGNLLKHLMDNPITSDRYVIPYLLNLTNKIDIDEAIQWIQVTSGDSGGIDIDSDFVKSDRDAIVTYLRDKFGDDCVTPVGTINRYKLSSTIKEFLKYLEVPFAIANDFTKDLDTDLSFEENMNNLKGTSPSKYKLYLEHKEYLDLVPKFLNHPKAIGTHAGGIVVSPDSIWKYCPVESTEENKQRKIITAFEESGSKQVLDALGLVKLDLLTVSNLDTITEAINLLDSDLYLIDEDGVKKIVTKEYLQEHISEIER